MTAASPVSFTPSLMPAPLRALAPYGLLALLIFAAYSNIFDNSFVFDDDLLISINTNLRSWHSIGAILSGSTTSGAYIAGGFYRPVQMLLYLVVFQLGGGSVFGFHLLNLALHIGNSCFVYRLGEKLGFKKSGVFIAALLWALHPLHTEAVTYMSATADPLFAFFCLWAVTALVPDITQRGIYKIIPLFLLALFSKETAVMLPLLVMSCLFLTSPRRLDWRLYLRTWPLWAMTIVYSCWRMQVTWLDGPQTYKHIYALTDYSPLRMYAENPLFRFYTSLATLPAYLSLLLWPRDLHMERSFPIFDVGLCAPVLSGMLIAMLAAWQIGWSALRQRGLALSWGLLWFAAAHAPDAGLLVAMNSLFLEHWMYLPCTGLFLGLAETTALPRLPRAFTAGALIICAGFAVELGVKTYLQNRVWHDAESFYINIFRYGEHSARARNNLALYYSRIGNYEGAIEQFAQAIAMTDTYAETRHNLALTFLKMPNQPEHMQTAIANLKRAIEIDPRFYRSWQTLGDIYAMQGNKEQADYCHAQALQIIQQHR